MRHLLARRRLAALICAATLLLKLLVPTGYMIGGDHGRVSITACPGAGPAVVTVAMPGVHGDMAGHGRSNEHGKAEAPCAFSGLSAAALGAIDPIQLADLVAFVLALGLLATMLPAPARAARLRPPLRGPPVYL